MRTTLDIDDSLYRELKKRAAVQGRSLTATIEELLEEGLRREQQGQGAYEYEPVTVEGASKKGVDVSDRDRLYDVMEGID